MAPPQPALKKKSIKKTLPTQEIDDSSSQSGQELGVLLQAIKQKYQKRTENEKHRFEIKLKEAVDSTLSDLGKRITDHNDSLNKRIKLIERTVNELQESRERQIKKMKEECREWEVKWMAGIKALETIDEETLKMGNHLIKELRQEGK